MPITFAREAWPFVLPFVVLSGVLFLTRHPTWGIVAGIVAFAVLLFFRDPKRSFDGDPAVIVAPADGVVTQVDIIEDPAISERKMRRVVTFLSAFDVHIQRAPTHGKVVVSGLKPGRKVAAFRKDADVVNENYLTVLERLGQPEERQGDLIGVRQIAGLMARRVVCYLKADQVVQRGDHLGLIKFGSRVDLMVPEDYEILVEKGQRLRNGETPVARPPKT